MRTVWIVLSKMNFDNYLVRAKPAFKTYALPDFKVACMI